MKYLLTLIIICINLHIFSQPILIYNGTNKNIKTNIQQVNTVFKDSVFYCIISTHSNLNDKYTGNDISKILKHSNMFVNIDNSCKTYKDIILRVINNLHISNNISIVYTIEKITKNLINDEHFKY